jgi:hypothetical protein
MLAKRKLPITAQLTFLSEARTGPPSLCFSQVLILKEVKVVCFDTLLQVLILKAVAVSVFLPSFARGDKSGLPQRHRGIKLGDTPTPGVP